MSKVKFKLNRAGVRTLLGSDEMSAVCQQYADRALGRCGEGYETQRRDYPERTGYVVRAATDQARQDNLKNNTLLKAVRG